MKQLKIVTTADYYEEVGIRYGELTIVFMLDDTPIFSMSDVPKTVAVRKFFEDHIGAKAEYKTALDTLDYFYTVRHIRINNILKD